MSSAALTYTDLSAHLRNVGSDMGAAEAHGLVTGLVATGNFETRTLLHELCPPVPDGDVLANAGCDALIALAGETATGFADLTAVFSPMLPDDGTPLNERAVGLRDWCEGFLYGLGIGEADQHRLPADVTEAVGDLGELTRLDVAIVGDTESEEQAFADLLEFVRAAVMMIHAELGANAVDGHESE